MESRNNKPPLEPIKKTMVNGVLRALASNIEGVWKEGKRLIAGTNQDFNPPPSRHRDAPECR